MANKTKSMLQIRKILQLLSEGSTIRKINRITGIHRKTIKEYVYRISKTEKDLQSLLSCSDHELSCLILTTKTEITHDGKRMIIPDKMYHPFRGKVYHLFQDELTPSGKIHPLQTSILSNNLYFWTFSTAYNGCALLPDKIGTGYAGRTPAVKLIAGAVGIRATQLLSKVVVT